MEPYRPTQQPNAGLRVGVPYRGSQLLAQPMYNKGSAFTRAERAAFGLEGLLPWAVNTMEQRARRVYENITRKADALERHIGLVALHDRNEHLFSIPSPSAVGPRGSARGITPSSFRASVSACSWRRRAR
jgi:malate dehydrogenase (oxaloacetate-decarboxylating)